VRSLFSLSTKILGVKNHRSLTAQAGWSADSFGLKNTRYGRTVGMTIKIFKIDIQHKKTVLSPFFSLKKAFGAL
jgi:hypothetical protein